MNVHKIEANAGDRTISFETGKLAKQADGAVIVQMGETVVMVVATMANDPRDAHFLPLTCDYRENTYAAGKIPGGFFRREGRPNDKETLTSRLMDRPIRPLFPEGFRYETQVIASVLSYDGENDPAPLALCGASAALNISRIPFDTLIAGVRVGLIDGEYVMNPTAEQRTESKLDLLMACSDEAIVMVEAGALEVSETEVIDALEFGHQMCKKIISSQQELVDIIKPVKVPFEPPVFDTKWADIAREKVGAALADALHVSPKRDSYARIDAVKKELTSQFEDDDDKQNAKAGFKVVLEELFKDEILAKRVRADGRKFEDIRDIWCEAGYLPRTHGSAVFQRGETQALVTATLGTAWDAQKIDFIEGDVVKRFMLHYNFPPYSVGEVRFLRGPGRREIGHGNLAERALRPVLPADEDFPYTIRIVSDILESNGSSSMASICGGSIAMMDAGVPLRSHVAGIAMGLVSGENGMEPAILSDIAGQEDHHGDMDFKVAGTTEGITALQMDIKVKGLAREVLEKALEQARQARLDILDKMGEAIGEARGEVSKYAPRIFTVQVPRGKIGAIIGPGGKTIRSIVERTGAKIDVEDDGRVNISSVDEESAALARKIIEDLTAEAEIGKTYLGRVVRIMDFGAFVEILPGLDGLCHVSELDEGHVADVRDVVEEGDEVLVKVLDIDDNDRIRLSRRAALQDDGDGDGGGGGGDGDGGDDGGGDDRPARSSSRSEGGRGRDGDRGGRGGRGGGGGGGRGGDRGGRGGGGGGRGGDRGGRGGGGGGRGGSGGGRGRSGGGGGRD